MDKELRNRYWRVVGELEAIERSANHAKAMPCDSATRALIELAQATLNKAVLSAWNYADERTSESEPESL